MRKRRSKGRKAFLDGNFARRKLPLEASEYCIWDTKLAGFGLRVRPSGNYVWFVRLRHRGKHRRITLGKTKELDAKSARSQARRLLAQMALDGLPKPTKRNKSPTLAEFVDTYWSDIARGWKASTAKRGLSDWRSQIKPVFGEHSVFEITRGDVMCWRDGCAGGREQKFNRTVPVLAALLKYAEALNIRPKGSNPCRGIPRFKQRLKERYLSPAEFRRLGLELSAEDGERPAEVAIIRLLLLTGARVSEIRDLQWSWVKPPRLMLPDSKTGPKVIYLNSQARTVLDIVPRNLNCPFVFPSSTGKRPLSLDRWWSVFRRRCAMPDLRIHDLRHTFASVAIQQNVPLSTIGRLLGHALPETTGRYAHLADDHISQAAQRVSGSLAQAIGVSA
ncbi:MAG: site-specific integrase [Pseudomonadota bacterium]